MALPGRGTGYRAASLGPIIAVVAAAAAAGGGYILWQAEYGDGHRCRCIAASGAVRSRLPHRVYRSRGQVAAVRRSHGHLAFTYPIGHWSVHAAGPYMPLFYESACRSMTHLALFHPSPCSADVGSKGNFGRPQVQGGWRYLWRGDAI